MFEFHPIRHTNDPFVVAQHDRMVAINSAMEVDVTGQVCSDSLGTETLRRLQGRPGGFYPWGGAVEGRGSDYRAAVDCQGWNALPDCSWMLSPGAGVVTSRADVHYVVTEHGIAYLHGKTLRQRAEALIAIADPNFQDELERAAVRAHQLSPRAALLV